VAVILLDLLLLSLGCGMLDRIRHAGLALRVPLLRELHALRLRVELQQQRTDILAILVTKDITDVNGVLVFAVIIILRALQA